MLQFYVSIIFLLFQKEQDKSEGEKESTKEKEAPARTLVTSDGAYATQSAFNLPKLVAF